MGDGVNIAARLEGIAKPDTICLAASRVPAQPAPRKMAEPMRRAFAGPTNGVEIPPPGAALKPISAARRAPSRPACQAWGFRRNDSDPDEAESHMQQIRKSMPTARQRMTAAKSARNRRSAEQISDLTAAGDVLNWDQATYMPRGGADARGRQCAVLYRLAHEQAVAPALGKLLDALAHYGESLPHDFDDASLIRVARRDFQKMIKIPPDHVARANAHGSASYNTWTRARPANDFAAMVPYLGTDARSQPGIFLLLCALQARG